MWTMPKSRKTADFTKRAQKVGKKKLAPTNATSTRFKVRSVALPEQAQFAADGSIEEPTSHRKLSTTDLLAQLSHYHFEKRSDALKGLTELLTRHPELLPPIAPSVTQRALLTCEDEYARVRGSALALLKVVLPLLHHAGAIGPHEQTLRLRLQSAISHPTRLVRLDALPLLALMLDIRPSLLVPPPPLLLPALSAMLTPATPAGERAAATLLETTAATVLAVRALIEAQLAPYAELGASSGRAPAAGEGERHRVVRSGFAFSRWRGAVGSASDGASGDASSGGGDEDGCAWLGQCVGMPTLLVRCWIECGLSGGGADGGADGLGGPEALGGGGGGGAAECGVAIVAMCKQLLLSETLCGTPDASSSPLAAELTPPLLRHVAPHVPLVSTNSQAPTASAGDRRRRDAAHGAGRRLDASFCELVGMLLVASQPDGGNYAAEAAPALAATCARASQYICDELTVASDSASSSAASAEIGVLLRASHLLLSSGWAAPDACVRLRVALLEYWEAAPPTEPLRDLLLTQLAPALLPALTTDTTAAASCASLSRQVWRMRAPPVGSIDGAATDETGPAIDETIHPTDETGHAIDEAYARAIEARCGGTADGGDGGDGGDTSLSMLRDRFLRSLPRLLWQLGDSQPALSLRVLTTLTTLARTSPPDAPHPLQPLQPMLEPYFCALRRRASPSASPLLGPFATSRPAVRYAACQLVQWLRPMSESMVDSLAACACLAPAVAPELVGTMLSLQRAGGLTLSLSISFILTVALDAAQGANASSPPVSNGAGEGGGGEGTDADGESADATAQAQADHHTASGARERAWQACITALAQRAAVGGAEGRAIAAEIRRLLHEAAGGGEGGGEGGGAEAALRRSAMEVLATAVESAVENGVVG